MFITFEGIDGAGKTTQIEKLKSWFEETQGKTVLLTREPGATDLGKQIRELVLHSKSNISEVAELFLFASDRAQHVSETIRPALENQQVVISDRYFDSTTAYQGYGRNINLDLIQKINQIAIQGIVPQKTFLLDGPVEELLARAAKSRGKTFDRLEANNLDFFERTRNGFLTLAKENLERFVILDATQNPNDIFEQIKNTFENL